MHILKKTLISIITCSLLILSVGAEEPVTEDTEEPLVYNAEEENTVDAGTDTTVVADDENAEDVVDNSTDIDNVEASTPENNISSESAEEVSNPVEDTPTIELGEFKNEVTYNEDHTVATIVVEYLGECTELNLVNEEIIQQMVNTGVYQVNLEKGDWTNKIAFDVLVNGIVPLEINVWNEDTLVGTKMVMTSVTGLNNDALIFEPNQSSTYEITSSDVGSTDSRKMTLSYETNVSFTWSIPTELSMAGIEDDLTVTVNNSNLATETALRIRVSSANGNKLIDSASGESLSYIITDLSNNLIRNNDVILDHTFNQESSSNKISFSLSQMPVISGSYSDNLTFTASIERLLRDLYSGQEVMLSNLGTTHNFTNLKIYGVGYQVQSSGKNLWDEQWEYGSYAGEPGEKVGKAYDADENWKGIRSKNKIYLTPNETYYMCANFAIYIQTLFIDSNDTVISYAPSKQFGYSFTVPENCAYVLFRTNSNYGSTYKNNIAIVEGYSGIYEPYTGGLPAPSPENPSEIQYVLNPSIKVNGVNLINRNTMTIGDLMEGHAYTDDIQKNYVTDYISVEEGSEYILSGNCKKSAHENAWFDADKNYIKRTFGTTLIAPQGARYVRVEFEKTVELEQMKMQLEKGTVVTEYQQYVGEPQYVAFPCELNAIPVSSGGNVTVNGQQYISDYIDVDNKKLVRMIGETTIKVEAIQLDREYNTYVIADKPTDYVGYHSYDTNYETLLWDRGIQGHLNLSEERPSGEVACDGSWDSFFIALPKSVNTQEEAEALINDSKIIYVLSSPKEIPLSDAEVQIFKELYTYTPTTLISASSDQLTPYIEFGLS